MTTTMSTDIGTVRLAIVPRLLFMAAAFRVLLIIFMAVSDAAIPDHNPGDDVLRFDLRLSSDCFCLEGLACDSNWNTYNRSRSERLCIESSSSQGSTLSKLFLQPMTKWDAARFLTLAADPKRREPGGGNDDQLLDNEQAHAFFPLFSLLIRHGALFLIQTVPKSCLPPTFEGVLVISALLINTISFLVALLCLVDLTLRLTLPNEKALQVAGTVATLFCLNPASIFFATSYSESFFAMCTFGGYVLYTSSYSYLAVVPWMAASYTRSNGCLIAAWLLIQGIAACLQTKNRSLVKQLLCLTWHLLLAAAVVTPILVHDRAGYALHCQGEEPADWCFVEMGSFYSYVQRKHWNVGFLHYYELKQIPNFLLAAPILVCSALGVSRWIQTSWTEQTSDDNSKGFPLRIIQWAIWAQRRSQEAVHRNTSGSILHSPQMLPHYAVLAAVALLGFAVAHVQIATRLICSTCPAIYWHLAHLCLDKNNFLGLPIRRIIFVYLGIYILIGTILHVNFLPWT
jgi:phosphatidylinositol glycan class V